MFVVQKQPVPSAVSLPVMISEPSSVKAELDQLIIKPLRENFNKLIDVLSKIDAPEALISENYSLLVDNRIRSQKALDIIKQAKVQESIASLGLRGFNVKLDMEGIQLDVTSNPERQSKFLALLREYVFLYPRSNKYPPPLNDGYKAFKYTASEKETVCFYWPLYGYILRMFLDKSWSVNITDLFLLKNMRAYCNDPFEIRKKRDDNKEKKDKEKKALKDVLDSIRGRATDKEKNNESSEQQIGGENEKSELPIFIDPLDEEEKRREDDVIQKAQEGKLRTIEDDIKNRQTSMISSFAQQCDPLRFIRARKLLKLSLVEWEIAGQKITISEFDAFENIVVKYIQDETKLKDGELLIGAQPNQRVKDIYHDDLETKKWSKTISLNEPAIMDPLLGVTYTWGNLLQWFGYPQKAMNKGRDDREDQEKIVTHLLRQFRSRYTLPSAMFKLEEKTLSDVRGRFLKFLEIIFTLLRDLYLDVEKKLENTQRGITQEKEIDSRSRDFMIRLNQEIAKSDDPSKRLRLEKIKVEALQKLKPFLSS